MNFNELKEFVKLVDGSKFKEIELCMDNVKIRLSEYASNVSNPQDKQLQKTIIDKDDFSVSNEIKEAEKTTIVEETEQILIEEKIFDKDTKLVKSPIVGCFYESPSPDKPAFVKLGDKVKKGNVLCVIEAMKVMNEITSPYDGEIKEILVSNEDMVEFDQPIFVII